MRDGSGEETTPRHSGTSQKKDSPRERRYEDNLPAIGRPRRHISGKVVRDARDEFRLRLSVGNRERHQSFRLPADVGVQQARAVGMPRNSASGHARLHFPVLVLVQNANLRELVFPCPIPTGKGDRAAVGRPGKSGLDGLKKRRFQWKFLVLNQVVNQ